MIDLEPEDVSQIVKKELAVEAYEKNNKSNDNSATKTVGIMLTLISLLVGAAIWATTAHADIKDWTAEQDYVTRKQLTDAFKESYVKREEFAKVETNLENLCEKHEALINTLDKMNNKLDNLRDNIGSNKYNPRNR